MGFKKISSRYQEKEKKKKYSRFRKIQRFKRDRMEIQEKEYVHSFVIWNPSIFFLSRRETSFDSCIFGSCSFFQQTFGGLWNSSLHHEKCKVDFHAANTRGIPIDLFSLPSFSFFFPLSLYYSSSFSSAFHESPRGKRRRAVFHRHRLLVKMQNGGENFSDRAIDTPIPGETWEK